MPRKQFIELPTISTRNAEQWLNKVCSSALLEIKERGVLIFCETIDTANTIEGMLKGMQGVTLIKKYTINNMNQERQIEMVEKGEIIVATMIAGRGTDIKTNEIEESGNLKLRKNNITFNNRFGP